MKKLILSGLLLHFFTVIGFACTCGQIASPYQAYKQAQAVFIGEVTGSEDIPYDRTAQDPKFNVYDRHFRFSVREVLKGSKTNEITISVGRIDSSCYRGFTIGETYLVYAYSPDQRFNLSESYWRGAAAKEPDNVLFVRACTRTDALKHSLDDLIYLRGMLQGKTEPALYGSVSRLDNDPENPDSSRATYLNGISIIAEGNQKQFSTTTDETGLYSFKELPEGEYKVHPVVPDKYLHYWFTEEKVEVSKNHSGFAEFMVGWNNRVEGTVTDGAGNIVRRAVVRLLSVDSPADRMSSTYKNIADYLGDAGKYQIYGKTPGRYLLVVEVYAPFLSGTNIVRTYYPQTKNRADALVISLGETDKLQQDIKLTSDQPVRWISGVMQWSDGTPVSENGWVALEKLEDSDDKKNVRYDLTNTDKAGNFKLQVFENAEYWVNGSVSTLGLKLGLPYDLWNRGIRDLQSTPIKIIGSRATQPLVITVPLPAGAKAPKR